MDKFTRALNSRDAFNDVICKAVEIGDVDRSEAIIYILSHALHSAGFASTRVEAARSKLAGGDATLLDTVKFIAEVFSVVDFVDNVSTSADSLLLRVGGTTAESLMSHSLASMAQKSVLVMEAMNESIAACDAALGGDLDD